MLSYEFSHANPRPFLGQGKGAKLADAYVATEAAHHDRRIPIPVGLRKTPKNL